MSNGHAAVARMPLALFGALAMLVAGVGVARHRTEKVEVSPELRYAIGAPSDGLALTWVADGLENWSMFEFLGNFPDYSMALYGTSDDPAAPAILIGRDKGVGAVSFGGSDPSEEHGVGCSTDQVDTLRCSVSVGHELLVMSHSHGLERAEVQAMLGALTTVGGNPRIPEAVLPDGMHLLKTRSQARDGSINNPHAGGLHGATAGYTGTGERRISLVVGRADEQELSEVTLLPFTRRTVDGTAYFVASKFTLTWVVWQQDGRAFYLLAQKIDADTALAMAHSVRPATITEWTAASKGPAG
jgi:hypothetical protein